MPPRRVTMIGVGQTLRGDDAAGIEAVRRWQQDFASTAARAEVSVQLAELPGLALLDMLEGFEAALIVDAVDTNAPPGTVFRLGAEELSSFAASSKSAHGWGIAETLKMDRVLNTSARRPWTRLVAIAAASMELGQPLSPRVEAALPAAAYAIEAEIQALLAEHGT